jgi:hypothetical protein
MTESDRQLLFRGNDGQGDALYFCPVAKGTALYSNLHFNEESKKVGRNKRSVSGMDAHTRSP